MRGGVFGFDINQRKIEHLRDGLDETGEVSSLALSATSVFFTSDESDLDRADFFIIAVPTPVDQNHIPDNSALISASEIVGRHLKKGDYVVYESTVYPGMTEELCVPILENVSGMKMCRDFKVGYSPERINPGDGEHRFENIIKVVSGCDEEALDVIASVYGSVVKAGVYKAESIRVAEAAKVIENAQRDINIAFMNELSILFHKMDLDLNSVLNAASTKWNFLNFHPGLVGGHCIGVDPYYLTYKAEQIGYHPQILLAGRHINDGMGAYVANMAIKRMAACDIQIHNARIGIFGVTFKENCPDIRNSKVFDIIRELEEYGVKLTVTDPMADAGMVREYYDRWMADRSEISGLQGIVVAVCHDEYRKMSAAQWKKFCRADCESPLFFDLRGVFNREQMEEAGLDYWRL